MRDLYNSIKVSLAEPPAAATTDNTAWVSTIANVAGFESLTFVGIVGALADADATFAVLVEHGDDASLSDAAAVADSDLLGTEADAGFQYDDDNSVFKIGYRGDKQYVRVTVTPSGNTGNAFFAGAWIQGHARHNPVA